MPNGGSVGSISLEVEDPSKLGSEDNLTHLAQGTSAAAASEVFSRLRKPRVV